MPVGNVFKQYPTIFSVRGKEFVAATTSVALNTSTPAGDIAIGSFIVANGAVYDAVTSLTTGAIDYYVTGLFDANGNAVDKGFVNTTELAAAQYYAEVVPVGGVTFEGSEDAVGGGITDANDHYYCVLAVGTPVGESEYLKYPYGSPIPSILIDSSSANSSSSSKCIHLLGVSPRIGNPAYDGTTRRNFLFEIVTPGASM